MHWSPRHVALCQKSRTWASLLAQSGWHFFEILIAKALSFMSQVKDLSLSVRLVSLALFETARSKELQILIIQWSPRHVALCHKSRIWTSLLAVRLAFLDVNRCGCEHPQSSELDYSHPMEQWQLRDMNDQKIRQCEKQKAVLRAPRMPNLPSFGLSFPSAIKVAIIVRNKQT